MKRSLRAQVLDLFVDNPGADATTAASTASLTTPQLPVAKRLNRNALTVAAVIMAMTVIACLVVLRGDSQPRGAGKMVLDPAMGQPVAPSFLDRPARESIVPSPAASSFIAQSAKPSSSGSEPNPDVEHGLANTSPTYGSAPGLAVSAPQRARDAAFDAALRHSALGGASSRPTSGSADGQPSLPTSSLAGDEARLVAYGDSVIKSATQPTLAVASPIAAPSPKRTFMQQAGDLGGRSSAAHLEPSSSPYVLSAGTVISAILLTSITSDLPGDCLGQVSRDVYDSPTQRILLVPKGSKLMCRYDDQVVAGQGRLLVAWTRLLLPDGRSMTLPGLALKDAQGQTGANGDVDNHTRRVFGRALLLSAIGAGAQLSQPRQVTILAAPTTGQVMSGAVGQELSNVALEILRRGMDQPPTITVPQGQTFNVFLNGDLVFDGPYDRMR